MREPVLGGGLMVDREPTLRDETGTELELFVAGVISTYPPFDQEHPSTVLPMAKNVLEAIADWMPSDDVERLSEEVVVERFVKRSSQ